MPRPGLEDVVVVVKGPVCYETDVAAGDHDPDQRRPGPLHVLVVELADEAPQAVADGVLAEVVDPPGRDVPAGVAAERVAEDEHGVDEQDQAAHADAETTVEIEAQHGVPGEDP